MATRFEALEELADDALELPIKGKLYRIQSPSALDGLTIQRITTLAARLLEGGEAIDTTMLEDDQELDLIKLCLGATDEELINDGMSWSTRRHVGLTAMFWIVSGTDTAETYWAAAGNPSQAAPNREARRAQSGSDTASKTRSRGSTSGTSAPRATAKRRKADQT